MNARPGMNSVFMKQADTVFPPVRFAACRFGLKTWSFFWYAAFETHRSPGGSS